MGILTKISTDSNRDFNRDFNSDLNCRDSNSNFYKTFSFAVFSAAIFQQSFL